MTKIKHKYHLWQGYNGIGIADKESNDIDIFAYEAGDIHNGPKCILCGYAFCHHCNPEGYDTKCKVGYYTCENCAGIIDETDKFCKHCGKKFD